MAEATAGAKLSYIHPGPPQSRRRIVRRAFANPERLDPSQRGMRCSLSLGERARVRGNETQPTETAGRSLQAQLDRLPESEFAITSSAEPVDGRRARGRKRIGVSSVSSPSPRPLPWGGRIARRCVANPTRWVVRVSRHSIAERTVPAAATSNHRKTQDARSLSQRERARVRGNETQLTETAGPISQAQLDRLPK